MVTTRRPTNRPPTSRITREAVTLFKRVEAMLDEGADEEWEKNGGRRREYLDALSELDRQLNLRPWETSPCHVKEAQAAGLDFSRELGKGDDVAPSAARRRRRIGRVWVSARSSAPVA